MPKLYVTEADVSAVERWLRKHEELNHIRVRKRGDTLILESGPERHSVPHARLRRREMGIWALEMPYRDRWEITPFQDYTKEALLDLLLDAFGWTLMPLE
jgi:hypothetical protein